MSVQVESYCYNADGKLCVTIKYDYTGVSAAAADATHDIDVQINGAAYPRTVTDSSGTDTFCSNESKGPIEASDVDGSTGPIPVDPPDGSNKCPDMAASA